MLSRLAGLLYELSTQVAFLWNQLNGSAPNNNEQVAGNLLKQTTTPQDAAWSFLTNYERDGSGPNSQDAITRETYAQEAYQMYAASAASNTGSGSSTALTSNCTTGVATGTGGTVTGCNFTNTGDTNNDLFTTETSVTYANVATMCQRAQQLVNSQLINPDSHEPFCANGDCAGKCDFVAGIVWGYLNSGYNTAYIHWQTMESEGLAHPGDRNPPVGALLFYKDPSTPGYPASDDGHIVVYLGNNMVISSDISPTGQYTQGAISIVPADKIEAIGFGDIYLGWSTPVFAGAKDPTF